MAHEISTVSVNGQRIVEAVFANHPAWHGLGKVWNPGEKTGLTSEEARKEAHLDWEVEKVGLLTEDMQTIKQHFGMRRKDTGRILGVVGPRYTPFQNEEGFDFLDSLMAEGELEYESAFALRGGERVCLVARMPGMQEIAEGDKSLCYVHAGFSHDGTGAITFNPTSVRVVCANTDRLSLTEGKAAGTLFSIRHTGGLVNKLEAARTHLGKFSKMFADHGDRCRKLASVRYDKPTAGQYMETLFPIPTEAKTTRALSIREDKLQAIRRAFLSPANTLPSIKGTWWALYNAVTEAVDHSQEFNKFRGEEKAGNRYESLTEGAFAGLKAQAFKLAETMSGIAS
jgi:phage/plasmid-like protein (TIGR03299 family)